MKYTLIILLLLGTISCTLHKKEEIKYLREGELINKIINLEKVLEFKQVPNAIFTSIAEVGESIITFDLNSGRLFRFDQKGNVVDSTGGIGRGPNEFIVDVYAEVMTCDQKHLIVFDWNSPKITVYDEYLQMNRIISLNNLPYEISCYSSNELLVFYSNTTETHKINMKGEILEALTFDKRTDGFNPGLLKHVVFKKGYFFQAYMLEPKLVITDLEESHREIYLNNNDTTGSATRSLSTIGDEIHLFYDDINDSIKQGYSFKIDGTYNYSYSIPNRINYIKFLNTKELLAIESASGKLIKYRYYYE